MDSTSPFPASFGDTIKLNDKWGNGSLILESYSQSYPPINQGIYEGCW
jgi:hypothetical protein